MKVTALIAAAGSSTRFGGDKLHERMGSMTVLEMSINAFQQNEAIDSIVVVTAAENISYVKKLGFTKVESVVKGGETRAASIKIGMRYAKDSDYVLIHDGARPLVSQKLINDVISVGFLYGAAAPFVPMKDSVKLINGEYVEKTIERDSVMAVQTPQMFSTPDYLNALKGSTGLETDDCEIAEKAGIRVAVAEGDFKNIKITTREDIVAAKGFLGFAKFRTGYGYDVHTLGRGEQLVLCGVKIPFEMGLIGHSDADVAAHAAADAVLGAAGLRDIGYYFPDTDENYKGANSIELFKQCCALAAEKGYSVGNIDITIVAQQPKLSGYNEAMCKNIADAAGIPVDAVSVKATTEEGLGFTGEFKGMAAHASVLLVLE